MRSEASSPRLRFSRFTECRFPAEPRQTNCGGRRAGKEGQRRRRRTGRRPACAVCVACRFPWYSGEATASESCAPRTPLVYFLVHSPCPPSSWVRREAEDCLATPSCSCRGRSVRRRLEDRSCHSVVSCSLPVVRRGSYLHVCPRRWFPSPVKRDVERNATTRSFLSREST